MQIICTPKNQILFWRSSKSNLTFWAMLWILLIPHSLSRYSLLLDVTNFEKFPTLKACDFETVRRKNSNFIRDSVKQIRNYVDRIKKPFVFAIVSVKVGIFRREQRKMPFLTEEKSTITDFLAKKIIQVSRGLNEEKSQYF